MSTWYLHYDEENKPVGFSQVPPADIAYIPITEEQKEEVEKEPEHFLVLSGSLCRLPTTRKERATYYQLLMARAPKSEGQALAVDPDSLNIALTGIHTERDFYIRVITARGYKLFCVPANKGKDIMSIYHVWLTNNNLKENH